MLCYCQIGVYAQSPMPQCPIASDAHEVGFIGVSSNQQLWLARRLELIIDVKNSILRLPQSSLKRHDKFNPLMATLKPQSNGPINSITVIGTLAVDGWAVTFGTWAWARCGPAQSPFLSVLNVTAHPSTAPVYQLYIIWCGTIITFAYTGLIYH